MEIVILAVCSTGTATPMAEKTNLNDCVHVYRTVSFFCFVSNFVEIVILVVCSTGTATFIAKRAI